MSRKAEFLDFERIDAFVKTLFGSGLNKVIFAFEPSLIVCTSMLTFKDPTPLRCVIYFGT